LIWINDADHCSRSNHADLPVKTPTKFDSFVNLKTATTLGQTVSSAMLARADAVIE
jgi:putative ABC transport system substrate-binding protein